MHVSAERGFQSRNKLWFHVQAGDECARDCRPDPFRIVETFQDGLRTFFQTVALFRHLTQDFETSLFLRDRPLQTSDFFFRRRNRRCVLLSDADLRDEAHDAGLSLALGDTRRLSIAFSLLAVAVLRPKSGLPIVAKDDRARSV